MSDVTTYKLSDEELRVIKEKRPPKEPLRNNPRDWRWQFMTKESYEQHMSEGKTEQDLINEIPWLTKEKLEQYKKEW